MTTIQLPSGQRILLSNGMGYVAAGAVVTFTLPGGVNPLTETMASAHNASALLAQIDGLIDSTSNQVKFLNGSPAQLYSVAPSAFVFGAAGIQVTGSGFNGSSVGSFYAVSAADALTGTLTNSYQYSAMFISPTLMQISYFQTNGSPVSVAALIYVDVNGLVSNPITVATGAGTGLTWVSVAPSAVSNLGPPTSPVVTGTGFVSAGITNISMLIPPPGTSNFNNMPFTVVNDTTINISSAQLTTASPPGVWTIYYSIDGGMTFTGTGLTVTAS
jgi:hypothetical protein